MTTVEDPPTETLNIGLIDADTEVGTRFKIEPDAALGVDPYWTTLVANDGALLTFEDEGGVEDVNLDSWNAQRAAWVTEVRAVDQTEQGAAGSAGPAPDPAGVEEPSAEEEAGEPETAKDGHTDDAGSPAETTPLDERIEWQEQAVAKLAVGVYRTKATAKNVKKRHDEAVEELEKLYDVRESRANPTASPMFDEAGEPTPDAAAAPVGEEAGASEYLSGLAVDDEPAEPLTVDAAAEQLGEQLGEPTGEQGPAGEVDIFQTALQDVPGITGAQAGRMAEKGIKTIEQLDAAICAAEEAGANWWGDIKHITAPKADKISECVMAFVKPHAPA